MDSFMFLALSTIALLLFGLSQKKSKAPEGYRNKSNYSHTNNREKNA